MREIDQIKFRVKIKGDAGVYEIWALDWLYEKVLVKRNCGDEWVAFAKIQDWMQFTELKDCNGVEIFEGDIIKGRHDYGPGGFHEVIVQVYFHETDGYQWNYWLVSTLEVIGNIHQDSHLLEHNKGE